MYPILSDAISSVPDTDKKLWILYVFFLGLLFSLIGFSIGWLIWRHQKAEAARLNSVNQNLLEQHGALERKFRTMDRTFARATSEENG